MGRGGVGNIEFLRQNVNLFQIALSKLGKGGC